ncbi:hypothetical protein STEG23_034768, partial [Scotinomys teguina]
IDTFTTVQAPPISHLCSLLHKVTSRTLFIVARHWKQPRCPSTEEWIKKMWCIYAMGYCLAVKKEDIIKFVGKWMELEKIIVTEATQTQKDNY